MHYIFKYFKTAFYAFNKCDTFMYLINNNEKNNAKICFLAIFFLPGR